MHIQHHRHQQQKADRIAVSLKSSANLSHRVHMMTLLEPVVLVPLFSCNLFLLLKEVENANPFCQLLPFSNKLDYTFKNRCCAIVKIYNKIHPKTRLHTLPEHFSKVANDCIYINKLEWCTHFKIILTRPWNLTVSSAYLLPCSVEVEMTVRISNEAFHPFGILVSQLKGNISFDPYIIINSILTYIICLHYLCHKIKYIWNVTNKSWSIIQVKIWYDDMKSSSSPPISQEPSRSSDFFFFLLHSLVVVVCCCSAVFNSRGHIIPGDAFILI